MFAFRGQTGSNVDAQVIICGDSELLEIPGGWGAAGGPNDGWHQFLHKLTQSYHSLAVGWGTSLGLRKQLSDLNVSPQGSISTKQLGI